MPSLPTDSTDTSHDSSRETLQCSQIKARNSIERTFGVLKRRFPALKYGLRVKILIHHALPIIVATAVLHNITILAGEDEPEDDEELYSFIAEQRCQGLCVDFT